MNIDEKSQRLREKLILAVYSLYAIATIVISLALHWEPWTAPVVFTGMTICIIMHLKKFCTYYFRAFFTAFVLWMNYSLYVLHTNDFTNTFAIIACLIILTAVYCIPEITYVNAVIYSLHLLYHLLLLRDLDFSARGKAIALILRLVSVYIILYVTYRLIKTQTESYAELLENIDSIKSAEQSKDDFMANMSHEIRTPINTVCGISEMVLRENISDEVRNEIYDIQTAGRNLLSIVSDILDFMELSSGKMEIVPNTYNITSTVNDIMNMTIARISDKNLELIVDCDADIPSGLVGDEQKIRRAILNVVDNAVKFTQEGGIFISIAARREEYGANLIITVRDTGIGMDRAALEKLFTSFSQVDTKRNRQEKGLGLGLVIAKAIANKTGGFISVRSKPGRGTSVKLVFPQKISDSQPIVSVKDPEKIRVLLYIDMNKYSHYDIRDAYAECISHIIQQLAVECKHCRSLPEVRRRLEKEKYTHLFVSWEEYCEDKSFFNMLSENMIVILVLDRDHKASITGRKLLCVYKPFYVLSIAAILNGHYIDSIGRNRGHGAEFTAPSASALIVDDNLMNLRVAEGLLRPYKIKIFLASGGAEALRKLESIKPDIVFMDHMMPEMDGVETFHRIRSKPGFYYQNVPVVALTANAVGGAREMFLNEGFSDYVTKPIELSALERSLRTFIPDSKIINHSSADESRPDQPAAVLTSRADNVPVLDGVDSKLGISYCGGNTEDYIEIVRVYYDIGKTRYDEIRKYYQAQDWENYTILIHAVKSTSLNIGAVKLSQMAERSELAGKAGNSVRIAKEHDKLLGEYRRILKVIGRCPEIFPEGHGSSEKNMDGMQEITAARLSEKLKELSERIDTFEMESVAEYMSSLDSLVYDGKSLRELLSAVEKKISAFDFAGAGKELEELRKNVR